MGAEFCTVIVKKQMKEFYYSQYQVFLIFSAEKHILEKPDVDCMYSIYKKSFLNHKKCFNP